MVRVELDEAVRRGDGGGALAIFPLRVGHLELRLLRVAAVGIARLELLEVLDGLGPIARRHGVLRLAVEALRRPADRLVFRRGERAAAAQHDKRSGQKRGSK